MNAYDGYEELSSFTKEELANYRSMLLEKTKPQVEFIKKHVGKSVALDLGCGNGRLVISGWLSEVFYSNSMGVDISRSRIDFAKKWADDFSSPVSFWPFDITKLQPSWACGTTLISCITGAPNYFDHTALEPLLHFMKRQLKHGSILLELYNPPFKESKKTWFELPPEDKFRYYLEDWQYDAAKRQMRHEKIFIGRDGKIDTGRVETLNYYTEVEVREMLKLTGFKDVKIYGGWNDEHYSDDESDKMVVVAYV